MYEEKKEAIFLCGKEACYVLQLPISFSYKLLIFNVARRFIRLTYEMKISEISDNIWRDKKSCFTSNFSSSDTSCIFYGYFFRCGTVMDFIVCMMLDLSEPVTSDQVSFSFASCIIWLIVSLQNAASFGFFDCISMQWNHQKLEKASFPTQMLPKVLS